MGSLSFRAHQEVGGHSPWKPEEGPFSAAKDGCEALLREAFRGEVDLLRDKNMFIVKERIYKDLYWVCVEKGAALTADVLRSHVENIFNEPQDVFFKPGRACYFSDQV